MREGGGMEVGARGGGEKGGREGETTGREKLSLGDWM